MFRFLAIAFTLAVAGCGGSKLPTVPTDPDSVKKLEEQQMKASRGEG